MFTGPLSISLGKEPSDAGLAILHTRMGTPFVTRRAIAAPAC